MPLSNPEHSPAVLHFVQALQPRAVLDVGIGTGSYGLLLRQSLDIGFERLERENWQVTIDGVEVFERYRNPVWEFAYNRVILGDIRTLLDRLGSYDLVLCNDVLEHFEQPEAQTLVSRLLDKGKVLLATTPNRTLPQGAWGGNEAETHRSLLSAKDFPHLVSHLTTGITDLYACTKERALVYPLLLAGDRCPRVLPGRPLHPLVRIRRKWREWLLSRR